MPTIMFHTPKNNQFVTQIYANEIRNQIERYYDNPPLHFNCWNNNGMTIFKYWVCYLKIQYQINEMTAFQKLNVCYSVRYDISRQLMTLTSFHERHWMTFNLHNCCKQFYYFVKFHVEMFNCVTHIVDYDYISV